MSGQTYPAPKFAVGERVRLKGDDALNPEMSVQGFAVAGSLVTCFWFVGKILHKDDFHADSLVSLDRKDS